MRRTPLARTTPLKQRTGLSRGTGLKPVSDKRRRDLDAYRAARDEVRDRADGRCEMGTPVCTGQGVEAHHVRGRVGPLLTDTEWLAWTCAQCHRYAHEHPAEAYEHGWMSRRNGGAA